MMTAIAHQRAIDRNEAYRREIDRRSDAIRDDIDAGDIESVSEFFDNAPDAQRREFFERCVVLLLSRGADYMTGPMRTLAAPFQDIIAIGIDERVRREIAKEREQEHAA
ncbi:hypothetical protein PSm6_00310 [Pseudomonas solani]|uniref:Uncharacterized protein n=1 Tax=Pseudomonas solani TaxID=2731552 RepID=A0ABN6BH65_9PSED|nr:hypothetical protein [Pseudomonas solani]BCD83624.1 hypothetical protein PSm6_00310 [Pseudomonas solani]